MSPEDLRYTADHEWVRILADGSAEFGITDFAQDALGDIVYVQLADAGSQMSVGQSVAEVESVKSVSEIYAPMAGTVLEVNASLSDSPETINADPYAAGWLVRFTPADGEAASGLLDAAAYSALTQTS
jgi:glycine cleavage system H protein